MSAAQQQTEVNVNEEHEAEAPAAEGQVSGPTTEEDLQRELEEMRKRLEEQERETHERLLRTMADFENFRRRARQEREEIRQFANQELLQGLLPIMDDFDRALAAAEQAGSSEALLEGVNMIKKQMEAFLAKHGVAPVEAVGKPFDPSLHEAVLQAPATEEHPAGTVVEEIRRGYTLNGRLLRPALVKVAAAEEAG
jgi:molecular chaperone GrpE